MNQQLEIHVVVDQERLQVMRLIGVLDASTAPIVMQRGIACRAQGRNLVLNLSAVTFIASSGVGMLLGLVEEFRKGDTALRLAAASTPVRGILNLLNIVPFLPMDADEQAAIAMATKPRAA